MVPRPSLPSGTVTFLFTDIEGSTRLLQELGAAYRAVQERHAEILRAAIATGDGIEVKTEGDAFFAVFPRAGGAAIAAVEAQRGLAAEAWSHGQPVRVRMGLHTGEGELGGDDYLGIDVNRAARIAAAGHGGQVLLSDATRALVEPHLPTGARLRNLGLHRLKDLVHPIHLFDLEIEGLMADFPPPRTLDARPNNLPPQLTSFVGRRTEVEEIDDLLQRERLISLVGPGGTGKTRLAMEAAHRALDRFPDGVWFIDLSPITEPALVPSAAVAAVGVAEEGGREPLETLIHHLAGRTALLVFDNFEQVLPAVDVVSEVLGATPSTRALVTSREPLHVSGERVYEVSPLPLAPAPEVPDGPAASDAVDLFVDRAAAVRRGFELTPGNAGDVARIVAAVDGLPLAIELAAGRLAVFSTREVADQLEREIGKLAGVGRDLPERQRTLWSTIAWSHRLLTEPEADLFARLSVFAGGATLEAIEEIGGKDDVMDALTSLVDKSLVRRQETPDGETRFSMLQTVMAFAAERLAERGEELEIRRRLAAWVLAFAERAEPELTRDQQMLWLDRTEREHDNVRVALRFAIDAGDAGTALRIGAALWRFWQQRGHLREGQRWLDEALALPSAADRVRFRAETAAGGLAYWRVDVEETRRHYEAALEIARATGDELLVMEGLHNRSFVPVLEGRDFEARPDIEEAMRIAERNGDDATLARLAADLGWVLMAEGNAEEAIEVFERSHGLWRSMGDRWNEVDILVSLGQAHRLAGDFGRARDAFATSLDALGEVGNMSLVTAAVEMLAGMASDDGRHEDAVRLLGAGRGLRDRLGGGAPPHASRVGEVLPRAAAELGQEAVDRLLEEGIRLTDRAAIELARREAAKGPPGSGMG